MSHPVDHQHTPSRAQIVGTLAEQDGLGVVRMESFFDVDPDELWSALTDPARLARWLGDVTGDLRLGGRFQARFTSGWEGPGRVDVCERPIRLSTTMAPDTPEQTVIEAVFTAEQHGTRLVIEERGLPLAEVDAHGAGWEAHVEDLERHLTGRPAQDWQARWAELSGDYADRAVTRR